MAGKVGDKKDMIKDKSSIFGCAGRPSLLMSISLSDGREGV